MKPNSDKSLSEVHESVVITKNLSFGKKLFAFMGPAYLVSVGYMDPGNWATDIAGGSQFGYKLLWVLVMSNLMALLLQSLSARLGLVRGLDLAQASRASYPPVVNFLNWILAEIAIAACDLAEVIGMAIGLQLLFHIPLLAGISITVADTLLLLVLQRYGIRKMEAFILVLVATIGFAFIAELIFAKPDGIELLKGFIPSIPNNNALYIAIGIIGATVMPHNLYLHSSLVQTRKIERTPQGIKEAIKFNFIDSFIALNAALFINAAILILAAAAFFSTGLVHVSEIQDAHKLLQDVLGTSLAPALFAIALIAAGQSSTLTGTLSGQVVMEGYLNLRIQPWLRRLITRLIAIIPAFITIYVLGEESLGSLLILSQVILSLQLGFAVIPLIHLTSDKKLMGEFASKMWLKILAWIVAAIIVSLNAKLVIDTLLEWIHTSESPLIIYLTAVPLAVGAGVLLFYVTFKPIINKAKQKQHQVPDGKPEELKIKMENKYNRIAITVDFSTTDSNAISNAIAQGGKEAEYILIHIVETAGARMMGHEIKDFETESDSINLDKYKTELTSQGFKIQVKLGFGNPKKSIPEIVNSCNCDLLVMGAHGHRALKDIIFGTTLDAVRHNVKVPVLIVK
ncbi:MAG: iron/manganese transporter [Bacteroidetes bacterium RIFCSPLOWO2_12_FULL_35_15]|nr:MAG: iron/manganese transporter [Bacteroidetes bacterium RIFCSPLOWO2_12_FULL_35_15]